MKLPWAFLCAAVICNQAVSSPVKRNSPIEIDMATSMEQQSDNFEGDMVLSPEQEEAVKNGYTAIVGENFKWPNSVVPYKIDTTAFTLVQQNNINAALQQIELVSCVRFVPRTTQTDYVFVTGKDGGCFASVGHRGDMQTVNLQPDGCMSRGTIIHEFLHALGFAHMHSSFDRDFYVDIHEDAIVPSKKSNFNRAIMGTIDDFGIPYDYDSVMHYGPTAFSVDNKQQTITPKQPGVMIGQRVGLSYKDIKRLNYLYPNCY